MSKKRLVTMKPPRSLKRMFPEIKTVIDASAPIIVHVKSKDCATATSLDIGACAMAQAAKREFKIDAAVIGISTSYLIKGGKATRFRTPPSVQREIVSFDRHHDFEPGTYPLIPFGPSLRLGTHSKPRKSGSGGTHKPRRVIHKTVKVRTFSA